MSVALSATTGAGRRFASNMRHRRVSPLRTPPEQGPPGPTKCHNAWILARNPHLISKIHFETPKNAVFAYGERKKMPKNKNMASSEKYTVNMFFACGQEMLGAPKPMVRCALHVSGACCAKPQLQAKCCASPTAKTDN